MVTGAPRSGTTFVGKMLALPLHVAYVNEPFNTQTGMKGVERPFPYMKHSDDDPHEDLVKAVIEGKTSFRASSLRQETANPIRKLAREIFISRENLGHHINSYNPLKQRYLIKDPMACFSTEYLHQKFDFNTLIVMRHPASMVASYKRLGWRFNLNDLKGQPDLMDDHLKEILKDVNPDKVSQIEEGAYLWLAINSVLEKYASRNKNMIMVRHEDLSKEPLTEFLKIYDKFNLPYTTRVQRKIKEHTSSKNSAEPKNNAVHQLKRDSAKNISRWKKILTDAETEIVHKITAPLADKYYTQAEW